MPAVAFPLCALRAHSLRLPLFFFFNDTATTEIYTLSLHDALPISIAPPGARFIYSDINFILLGEIVRKLSGKPLPDYVREAVFRPLGMKETMFNPPARLRRRIAPTETLPGAERPLRGVVHDPTARYMDGIAGHAGLF